MFISGYKQLIPEILHPADCLVSGSGVLIQMNQGAGSRYLFFQECLLCKAVQGYEKDAGN